MPSALRSTLLVLPLVPALLWAQDAAGTDPLQLPPAEVRSSRVANQEPVGTIAMPVSALRYEPLVDLQARNLGEAQADVSIRGGIFENSAFRVGGVTLSDPQTGHYFAEIPIAPAMLTAPQILTGADQALLGFDANAGSVAYGWAPVTNRGELGAGWGQFGTRRASLYQGVVAPAPVAGATVAGDLDLAHSQSDGAIPNGDHHFDRVSGRLQFRTASSQTDLFAGYQAKFFGWPNLYTPFNSPESENLQTLLLALNHRVDLGRGDYYQFAAYYRRNKDDYAFDRFAPLGAVHPYQHTTWVQGAELEGRQAAGDGWALRYGAQLMADALRSTTLNFGRFHHRLYEKFSLAPETAFALGAGTAAVRAGATYDGTNRDGSAVSPLAALDWVPASPAGLTKLSLQYAQTTQVPNYTALNSSATAGLFRGNPDLGRETSRNLEAGATWSSGPWNATAAVFHRQDNSLVDWTYVQGVFGRTANPVDIGINGFETVLTRRGRTLDLVFGYTWLDKSADYRGAAVDASFYALNFARHRFTAAVVARLGYGCELRLDNEYRLQEPDLLRTSGREAFLSSLGFSWRPSGLRALELTLAVDNLWQSSFQEVPAVPASPRQVSAGATWRW
ncbi:MAG: TonB-dependent receptor plug domain-containing protein [Opitutales bacterium]